jgi:hypothetical protein
VGERPRADRDSPRYEQAVRAAAAAGPSWGDIAGALKRAKATAWTADRRERSLPSGGIAPALFTAGKTGRSHPWEQTRWCVWRTRVGGNVCAAAPANARRFGVCYRASNQVAVGCWCYAGRRVSAKTALLEYVAQQASGFRCARVTGVQSDMELAFAGLHQLCAPLLDHHDELPDPQCEALAVAFGRGVGVTPDRFLVGLAVLSLMAIAADDQPLLCVIDDAQWLDQVSVQTLAFVARRLMAEPVALVFAVRDGGPADVLAGLPELVVDGLSDAPPGNCWTPSYWDDSTSVDGGDHHPRAGGVRRCPRQCA